MKNHIFWTIGLAVAAATGASLVWGGTYNFYFTNTEQGANSTATPTVNVKDGKATSEGGPQAFTMQDGKVVPVAGAKPGDTVSGGPAAVSATQEKGSPDAEPEFRHLRLGFGFGSITHRSDWSNEERGAMVAEVGYMFTREIGINLFGGSTTTSDGFSSANQIYGGAELEITPIRASLFRMENFLALSAIGGANIFQPLFWQTGVLPHFGARADVNLGHQFGVSGVLRQTVGPSDSNNFMASVGLIIRI